MKSKLLLKKFRLLATACLTLTVITADRVALAANTLTIKAGLLADIAFEYAELEDKKQTLAVAEQALQAIEVMEWPCYQANPLARIGGSYLLIGNNSKGEQLLAEAITTAQAREKTGCSSSATSPTESLLNRAREYAKDGNFEIAMALSDGGHPQGLTDLAIAFLTAGQTQKARELLERALTEARKPDSGENGHLMSVLIPNYMARRLQEAGRAELSLQILEEAFPSPDSSTLSQLKPSQKADAQLKTARLFLDAGAKDRAIAWLEAAIAEITALPDSSPMLDKLSLQIDAAVLYQKAGLKERAATLLAQAEQRARERAVNPETKNLSGLGKVATGYARAGEFDRAIAIARSIQPASQQFGIFSGIVAVRLEAGDTEGALETVRASANPQIAIAPLIRYYSEQQPEQALALQQEFDVPEQEWGITAGFLAAEQPERALEMIRSASPANRESAPDAESQQGLEQLLPSVAGSFARQGEGDRALEIARSIEDPATRAQAFVDIASVWSDRDSEPMGSPPSDSFFSWLNSFFRQPENSNRDKAASALAQALDITRSLSSN